VVLGRGAGRLAGLRRLVSGRCCRTNTKKQWKLWREDESICHGSASASSGLHVAEEIALAAAWFAVGNLSPSLAGVKRAAGLAALRWAVPGLYFMGPSEDREHLVSESIPSCRGDFTRNP